MKNQFVLDSILFKEEKLIKRSSKSILRPQKGISKYFIAWKDHHAEWWFLIAEIGWINTLSSSRNIRKELSKWGNITILASQAEKKVIFEKKKFLYPISKIVISVLGKFSTEDKDSHFSIEKHLNKRT